MKIFIQEYQESWAAAFAKQQAIIQNALVHFTPAVEHIGSTSVAGLGAKPIIDILVGIENAAFLDKTVAPMQEAGFTYFKKYEPGWPGRRFFVQLCPLTTQSPPPVVGVDDDDDFSGSFISKTHVHVIIKNTPDWERHIAFRDYLKTHPTTRDRYYQLKKELSARAFRDGLAYNAQKNSFVKETEKEALAWRAKGNPHDSL